MTVFADLTNESEIIINTKAYNVGTNLREIQLKSGVNILNSSGIATISFQEGEL